MSLRVIRTDFFFTKFTFKIPFSKLKLKRFADFLLLKIDFWFSLSILYFFTKLLCDKKKHEEEKSWERSGAPPNTRAHIEFFSLRIDCRGAFDPAKLLIKGIRFVLPFFLRLQIIFIRMMTYNNSVFVWKSQAGLTYKTEMDFLIGLGQAP